MFDATLLVEFEAVLIFKLAGTKGLLLDIYMKFYVKKSSKDLIEQFLVVSND